MKLQNVELDKLDYLEINPKSRIEKGLSSLKRSVKKYGILIPPVIESKGRNKFRVVEGNGRVAVAIMLNDEYSTLGNEIEELEKEIKKKESKELKTKLSFKKRKLEEYESFCNDTEILCLLRGEKENGVPTAVFFREVNANMRKHTTKERLEMFFENPDEDIRQEALPKVLKDRLYMVKNIMKYKNWKVFSAELKEKNFNFTTLWAVWMRCIKILNYDFKEYVNEKLKEKENDEIENALEHLIQNGDEIISFRDKLKRMKKDALKKIINGEK